MDSINVISGLPNDIFTDILYLLDWTALGRCSQICKKLYLLSRNDALWKRGFPIEIPVNTCIKKYLDVHAVPSLTGLFERIEAAFATAVVNQKMIFTCHLLCHPGSKVELTHAFTISSGIDREDRNISCLYLLPIKLDNCHFPIPQLDALVSSYNSMDSTTGIVDYSELRQFGSAFDLAFLSRLSEKIKEISTKRIHQLHLEQEKCMILSAFPAKKKFISYTGIRSLQKNPFVNFFINTTFANIYSL